MADERDANDQPSEEVPDRTVLNYARPGTSVPDDRLVTVATFSQSWEAHLAAGKLEGEGIPAVIADENIVGTGGGIYTNMVGGIKLQVRQMDADRAREALPNEVRITQTKCPRCKSSETRQAEFSPGLKILFLLMLGLPYLFVERPWFCLNCGYSWRETRQLREDEDELEAQQAEKAGDGHRQ